MSEPPAFLGDVRSGKLHMADDVRHDMAQHIRTFEGQLVDVRIELHDDTRSAKANAYYWAVVLHWMEKYGETGYAKDELHDLMCDRFLTKKRFALVNKQTGEMEEREIPRRSRRLTIHEFYLFVEQVRVFAAEFLKVETPDPDPEYWRKREAA